MTDEGEGKKFVEASQSRQSHSSANGGDLDDQIVKIEDQLTKAQANLLELQELKERLEEARKVNEEKNALEQEHEHYLKLKDENEFLKGSISQYQTEIDSLKNSMYSLQSSLAEGMQLFQSRILNSLNAPQPASQAPRTDFFESKEATPVKSTPQENFFENIKEEKTEKEPRTDFFESKDQKTTQPEERESIFGIIEEKEPEKESFLQAEKEEEDPDALVFKNRISEIRSKISLIEGIEREEEKKDTLIQKTEEKEVKKEIAKVEEKKEEKEEAKAEAARPKKAKRPIFHAIKKTVAESKKKKAEKKAALEQVKLSKKEEKAKIKLEQDEKEYVKGVKPDTSTGKLLMKMSLFLGLIFLGGLTYQFINADKTKNSYVEQTKQILAQNIAQVSTPNGTEVDPEKKYASAYFDIAFAGTVWDTHNDTDMYISVQYPKNTSYRVKKPGSNNVWFLRKDYYLMKIDAVQSELSLADYIQSQALEIKYKQEEATIAKQPAIHMVLDDEAATVKGNMYYVRNGSRIYRIWYKTFAEGENADDAARVQKMLESINFREDPKEKANKQKSASSESNS